MSSTKPFSFDTIENFDDHINHSIPNYDLLHNAIISLAEFVTTKNTTVLDLGCSTGTLLKKIKHDGRKVGVDWSPNLLPKNENGLEFYNKDIVDTDLSTWGRTSLVTSIFTMQFIQKEHRLKVLREVRKSLVDDGAFIWAEKVLAPEGWQQELMTFSYYDYKRHSFSAEEIMNKEQDLRQLMRCNTSERNQELARQAGFKHSQMFWKFYSFECWIFKK